MTDDRNSKKIIANMKKARTLIKAKQYDKARQILRKTNHPKAVEWLRNINHIQGESSYQQSKKNNPWMRRLGAAILSLISVCGCLSFLAFYEPSEESMATRTAVMIARTETHETESAIATSSNATERFLTEEMAEIQTATASAQPTATITDTPTATITPIPEDEAQSTETSLQQSIAIYQGVESVGIIDVSYNSNGEVLLYAEITVNRNSDKSVLANDLYSYSVYRLDTSNFADFSLILDDGTTAVSYTRNMTTGEWSITTLETFNASRAETEAARPTNTPRPTSRPTQRPSSSSSNSSSSSSSQTQWNCSGDRYNCSSFSTCSEMRSYWNSCPGDPSNLDGNDNDGRPCESRCG